MELLLAPGYDVSLVLEMLDEVQRTSDVNVFDLATRRGITTTTIEAVLNSSASAGMLHETAEGYILTEQGRRLLEALKEFFTEVGASDAPTAK